MITTEQVMFWGITISVMVTLYAGAFYGLWMLRRWAKQRFQEWINK